MIHARIPIVNLAHCALWVSACRIMAKMTEHTVIVSIIRHHDRTIYTRLLTYNEVRASECSA